MNAPDALYHGSTRRIEGELTPVLRHGSEDHVHERAAVFATERRDVAALFMMPDDALFSIGFERDVAYVCIWGTPGEFAPRDKGGWLYALPGASFEKVGKSYEWQSFAPVRPLEATRYDSALEGMMDCGAQVYFIDDDPTFDRIVADKNDRASVLRDKVSENARRERNVRPFIA
ncbi:MAG TPA: hypothetical protein VL500_03575 [Candidatus Eisenbacteria bacterium]|nr:hypothetical protein [Candidatus Eisenbacteria bacterium]